MRSLRCCDQPLILRPTFEVVSAAHDPDLLGVGSSPYVGDTGNTFLPVPVAPTLAQNNRYLFRLCVLPVSAGQIAIIRGIRTYIGLRGEITLEDETVVPYEIPVTSPNWKFTDGNYSFHVRRLVPNFYDSVFSAAQQPGTSPQVSGSDSALLFRSLIPYVPTGAGIPPMDSVDYLATWRDMRYPWTQANWDMLRVPVPGPCTLVLYASIHQTDPETRPVTPPCPPGLVPDVVAPEDQFVAAFSTTARYGHVGGAMLIELAPGEQR